MAPGLCSVFEASQECEASFFFFFPPHSLALLFRLPAALAAICGSEIFPPLRSLCTRRAGRHRLANQWLTIGSLGSRWGEKGLARSLPSNIWLSWLLGLVSLQGKKDVLNEIRMGII